MGPFGSDAYLVALPTMAVDLGATLVTLQFSLWAYALGMAFGQRAIGSFSDRIGRRRVLISGASLVALGAMANIFVSSGPILGPLGGIVAIHAFGWRSIFAGIAIFAVALVILIATIIPESLPLERRQRGHPKPLRQYSH